MTTVKEEQKARSHEAILRSAMAMLRRRGIGGAGVAEVMREAGLTVGGFYAHFASKEALMAETLRRTLDEQWGRLVAGLDEVPAEQRLGRVVRRYLSRRHRDEVEQGCPMPAVLSELPTQGEAVREAFREAFEQNTRRLARVMGDDDIDRALGLVALMHGALALSRALAGSPLSDRVLRAARAAAAAIEAAQAGEAAQAAEASGAEGRGERGAGQGERGAGGRGAGAR